MITHSLTGQSGSQMINEQWPLTFDLWGRTLSARATGWAVSPGWADLDTSSSLCHRPRRSCSFRYPITTLPTKVLPYTSLPSFFEPFVLQHIFNGKFLSITNCTYQTITATLCAPLRCFNGALWVGSKYRLVFWFTPHYFKKWTNEWLTQWQKSPVFPCGVHLCASGISVSFPTAMCVWIILHCINPVLAVIFFQPRCIKMRTAAKCYPCVVSLYFALDAKQVNRPTGFFKWRPFRADQKEEIGAVACVCFCVCFRIIKLFKMSRDSCVKSWVYLMNVLKSRLKAVLVVQFMTFIVAVC